MVLELKLLKEINKTVLNLIKLKKEITINILRDNLNLNFNDLEWKLIKFEIKLEIQRIMSEQDSDEEHSDSEEIEVIEIKSIKKEPEKKKSTTTNKYEKAASKNLAIFTAMIAEPSYSDDDDPEEEEQEEEEEENYSNSDSEIEILEGKEKQQQQSSSSSSSSEVEIQSPPPKKKARTSTSCKSKSTSKSTSTTTIKNQYLSKEIISDSDEEANDEPSKIPRIRPPSPIKSKISKSKEKIIEKTKKKKIKRKSKGSSSSNESENELLQFEKIKPPPSKKQKNKNKSSTTVPKPRTRIPKEGDAPLGTEAEESKLKSLKTLLAIAGTLRPFNPTTGAERTLTVGERFDRIFSCFNDLGIGVTRLGRLPSGEKCKEVGERRALEKEMNELKGVPIISGLRGGKKLTKDVNKKSKGESSEEEEEEEEVKSSKHVSAKAFAAFLGDQSSSDDG